MRRPDGPRSPSDDQNGAADGAPLFPFLVVRNAPDSQPGNETELGTEAGSTIRRLLKLRYEQLQGAGADEDADFHIPPLIWLISRREAEWSLHAGYIEKRKRNMKAHCVSMPKPSN